MTQGKATCYHCDLPAVDGDKFDTEVLGAKRTMCCPGCQAVAEAIVANGLDDYYRFRTESGHTIQTNLADTLQQLSLYDEPGIQHDFVIKQGQDNQIQLTIEGITCGACGWLIEKQLGKLPGIKQVAINVTSNRALITWSGESLSLSQIMATIERIGYHPSPFQADQQEAIFKRTHQALLKRLGLAGLMTMQVMMLAVAGYFDLFADMNPQTLSFFNWVSLFLTTPVVFYAGAGFYQSAFKALKAKTVNMDVPVAIAVLGTYLSGLWATYSGQGEVYFESVCMFIFLLLISRFIEHQARHKAAQISANMLQYIPLTANVLIDDVMHSVLAKNLQVGQNVLVKAGQSIPIDGEVIAGHGQVDESLLTGEFYPVVKTPGDKVYGGTLNTAGILTIAVRSEFKHALVNQIARLQEMAMANKPKLATLADKVSRYFVSAVLVLSLGSYIIWSLLGNDQAFWIAISVLIATCPCALGLATPSALSFAMANLNKQGVLLTRADVLEQLSDIDTIMLDKTGTLTQGKIAITAVHTLPGHNADTLMQYAASIEQYSEHPIARAFAQPKVTQEVVNFSSTLGLGVTGEIQGVMIKLGSQRFMTQPIPDEIRHCSVFIQAGNQLLGGFVLTDKLRDDCLAMLTELRDRTLVLLSGDNSHNVSQVAEQLAISQWYAHQAPAEKLHKIQQAQQQGHTVMMFGDGINDGPVLAQADIAVTLGAGSDLAKSSADIILLQNSLQKLPFLFNLAKRCKGKIRQNILWALGYNMLILPLAISGSLAPWMAVIGMSLSSIIVVVNSVRLLK
ncbi:MAG: Cu2+-exporting ATPase [Paraglaciecola sp.]|jgi:Cu2+-exporting ATPase